MTNQLSTIYKLTRPNLTTHGGYQYRVGELHTFPGTGGLCGPGWSHAYTSAQLASFLNPIHANYYPYRLWRAEGVVGLTDRGLKVGCRSLRLVAEIEVPEVTLVAVSFPTLEHRVQFGILCALHVFPDASFRQWCEDWLSGANRSGKAAHAAYVAALTEARAVPRVMMEEKAWSAALAAAEAAEWAAAEAAWSAAQAAAWAAWAAAKAEAPAAARVSEEEAARAAEAAARVSEAATWRSCLVPLNLDEIAKSVLLPWEPRDMPKVPR